VSVLTDFEEKQPQTLMRKALAAIKTDAYLAVLAVLPGFLLILCSHKKPQGVVIGSGDRALG
jgi:hypothetical protein